MTTTADLRRALAAATDPLELAYMELRRRRGALDELDTPAAWRERRVMSPLEDVADYVKRIGNCTDSAHYRADKSGPLLEAAIDVAIASFENYYGVLADSDEDNALAKIDAELREAVGDARHKLWELRG